MYEIPPADTCSSTADNLSLAGLALVRLMDSGSGPNVESGEGRVVPNRSGFTLKPSLPNLFRLKMPNGPQTGAAKVTIQDLLADWRVRREALNREIAFWEESPLITPAPELKTMRQMALELPLLRQQDFP